MPSLREAATQALEALEFPAASFPVDRHKAASALRAALVEDAMQKFTDVNQEIEAALAEPLLQTCNCRWDGEVQVQQCTLHEAHVDAIKEWAQRAKFAEKKLAALAKPVQEPVAWRYVPSDVWGDPIVTQDPKTVELARQYARLIEPLYTTPPHRKPLTEEEIDGLMQSIGLRCADDGNERMSNHAEWERGQRRRIARAIERAHGIT